MIDLSRRKTGFHDGCRVDVGHIVLHTRGDMLWCQCGVMSLSRYDGLERAFNAAEEGQRQESMSLLQTVWSCMPSSVVVHCGTTTLAGHWSTTVAGC